jgi:hypothetical protein
VPARRSKPGGGLELVAAVAVFAAITLGAGTAHARRWVIFGGGETVSAVAEIEPALAAEVQQTLQLAEPAIGYSYGFFSLFFLDLFTFEGGYVLMDRASGGFIRLDEAEVARLAGKPIDQLGKPLLYRFPLGSTLLGLLALFFALRMYLAYRADAAASAAATRRSGRPRDRR